MTKLGWGIVDEAEAGIERAAIQQCEAIQLSKSDAAWHFAGPSVGAPKADGGFIP